MSSTWISSIDHVFRGLGAGHTERWLDEPEFEIWSGVYECAQGELVQDCDDLVATGELAPNRFTETMRDVILSDAPRYTGGRFSGRHMAIIDPHPAGIRLTWREILGKDTVRAIFVKRESRRSFARPWPWESGAMYAASLHIDVSSLDAPMVYSHELAHTLGFFHPAGHTSVPLPSIMRDARAITAHDELHGRILYHRPPGSRTADRDPASFLVNGLREPPSGAPDPSRIRLVE